MNLDEIEKLEREATKGPWYPDKQGFGMCYAIHSKNKAICGKGFCEDNPEAVFIDQNDAKFIAAAREFVPWACKRIREIRTIDAGNLDYIRKLEAVAEAAKNLVGQYTMEYHGSFGPVIGKKEHFITDMFADIRKALAELEKE